MSLCTRALVKYLTEDFIGENNSGYVIFIFYFSLGFPNKIVTIRIDERTLNVDTVQR